MVDIVDLAAEAGVKVFIPPMFSVRKEILGGYCSDYMTAKYVCIEKVKKR